MIDTFCAKTNGKVLEVIREGAALVKIYESQEGKKSRLIDLAFGDYYAIVADLESQGYKIIYKMKP